MPVTVIPAVHEPRKHPSITPSKTLEEFVCFSCQDAYAWGKTHVVASSFAIPKDGHDQLYPSSHSFVRSTIEAWSCHSHLVLRPDDIWFAILVQMNMYMAEHADELRHLFVTHQDKEALHVCANSWDEALESLQTQLERSICTPWMREWISPGFSTSTVDDERTAAVLMMGLMKSFFHYSAEIICGIPSITLLGCKEDWQRLLGKIDRLGSFGAEPEDYARRLRPLLSRMVNTFDSPTSADTQDFWNQMVQAKVQHDRCCGRPPSQYIVSGWILGFFYWAEDKHVQKAFAEGRKYTVGAEPGQLQYDAIHYGQAPLEHLPLGYAKAEFLMVNSHGGPSDGPLEGWILAGDIGKSITHGVPHGYQSALAASGHRFSDRPKPTFKDARGCFARAFRWLRFSRRRIQMPIAENIVKDDKMSESSDMSEDDCFHSTIQPCSGWVMFGPRTEHMVLDGTCGEEMSGPTVEAIKSCDGIEHYHV